MVDELGVEAAPRPPKPAPVVPPPAPKKRPVAAPAAARPKGNWDEVASVLGVDVPPRPPKPAPTVTSGPVTPKPATPRPAAPPPPAPAAAQHEDPSGDRTEVAPRPARRGDQSREGGGRRGERHGRRGGRDGGRPGRGRHERRSETRGEHSEERGERYAQPPAEELLADEMVSADFVDDLVSAEEEIEWGEEVSSEAAPRRETDEESRQGRRRRRRRGGRRRREAADRPSSGASRDFDEAEEEREHIDEIVDAIEASPIAEPDEREPLEEAVAAEGLDEKRRRRRRRRGRRRDAEGAANESSRHEPRDETDSDLDDLDAELPANREPAAFGAPRHEGESTNGDLEAEEDDDVHDDHELRPSHRAIPSWDEAIGVIVSANMEARAKNPHAGGQRGRGRGQRGQGRRS